MCTLTIYKARFVLSDQESLTAGGKQKGQWPYKAFYEAIVSIVNEMPSKDFNDLIGWWNEYVYPSFSWSLFSNIIPRTVFGDVSFSEEEEEDPEAPTVASLMRQQLEARVAREIELE